MHRARRLCLAVLTVLGTACGDSTLTSSTPTVPQTFTEVFSGTISQNGATSHPFNSQGSGTALATITALAPDPAATVGLLMGTWTGTACQLVIANDKATLGARIEGAVGGAGRLCVRVYDVGAITAPITYELTVVHP